MARGRFPYQVLDSYPGMSAEDTAIWEAYIMTNPNRFTSVSYNVRVGTGDPAPANFPDNFAHMVTQLSQLRIDAVGYVNEEACVIEVKPRVTVSTLGQILSYRELFREQYGEGINISACVIATDAKRDLLQLLERARVEVVIIEI